MVDYNIAPFILRDMERCLDSLLRDNSLCWVFMVFGPFFQSIGIILSFTSDGFRLTLRG